MPTDDGTPRPSDDELPPDPFPGGPFADGAPAAKASPSGPDLAELLGMLGGDVGGLAGAGGGIGALGGLFSALGAKNGLAWDAVRQAAVWGAAGGSVEPSVDPIERIRVEELVRSVLPVVAATTGIDIAMPKVSVSTRAGWAAQALEDHRALLERLAKGAARPAEPTAASANPLAGIFAMLGPMMISTAVGSLYGSLGTQALTAFDLILVPRAGGAICVVPSALASFASEWSIPLSDAMTHAVVHDLVVHAALSSAHVRGGLDDLLGRWADSASFDVEAVESRIESLMEDLSSGGGLDPARLATGAVDFGAGGPSPAQRALTPEFERLLSPIVGFIDDAVMVAGARLLGDNRQVVEAWRRRRAPNDTSRQLTQVLGLPDIGALAERGAAFVGGVVQRAGRSGLESLWTSAENLPTVAELDAPGLWLARLDLD